MHRTQSIHHNVLLGNNRCPKHTMVHPVFRRMDEHTHMLTVIVPKCWRWGAFIWARTRASKSSSRSSGRRAAAGSCGGGDRGGCPPSTVEGWRGVDQYVKIESDATHPAIPSPPSPSSPPTLFVPLGSSPTYASSTTLQPPLPGPAEGIAAQSTDLSPTHYLLRRRVTFVRSLQKVLRRFVLSFH